MPTLTFPKGLFQAAHLAGENDTRGLIRTLQIDTYTATGTPPQAAGVNSNTERVSTFPSASSVGV